MANITVLRKLLREQDANAIWQGVRIGGVAGKYSCPSCQNLMIEAAITVSNRVVVLDACRICEFLWFGSNQYELLSPLPRKPPIDPVLQQATERMALYQVRKKIQENESGEWEGPDHWWEYLLGFLGVPIEAGGPTLWHVPLMTLALIVLTSAVSLAGLQKDPELIHKLSLIPNQPWRMGGFNLLTHFFVHATPLHLAGNMYFLFVFGRGCEKSLGPIRYSFLLAIATIVGGLLHLVFNYSSPVPMVGASGGIFGLMIFYALKFPRSLFGFYVVRWGYAGWVRLKASTLMIIEVGFQIFGTLLQVDGPIAVLAHLGGALAGLLYWWWLPDDTGEASPTTA